MEIPGFGYFIVGDEFIGPTCNPEDVQYGKVVSLPGTEVLQVLWGLGRKEGVDVEVGDEIEDFESIKIGLEKGTVKVLDKQFGLGDLVRIGEREGEVVGTSFLASALVHETDPRKPRKVILNLPAAQLRPIPAFSTGERVLLNGWYGQVRQVKWKAFLITNKGELCSLIFDDGIRLENAFGRKKRVVVYKHQVIRVLDRHLLLDLAWENKEKRPKALRRESKWFRIRKVNALNMTVNWISRVPGRPSAERPPATIPAASFCSVIKAESRLRAANQTYCYYRRERRAPDLIVVDVAEWKAAFRRELWEENSRVQSTTAARALTGTGTKGPEPDSPPPPKRRKTEEVGEPAQQALANSKARALNEYEVEDNSIVDPDFTQQIVHVRWNDGEDRVHEILSRHLQRIKRVPNPPDLFRSFVQSKDPIRSPLCGLTLRRDFHDALAQVHYISLEKAACRVEVVEETTLDLIPHPEYRNIRIGAFAFRSKGCRVRNFSYGIVCGIKRSGQVVVETAGRKRAFLWPHELQIGSILHVPRFRPSFQIYRPSRWTPSLRLQERLMWSHIRLPTEEESNKRETKSPNT